MLIWCTETKLGRGEIPGFSFMDLEKFHHCQAKEWEERIHAKCRGLSSRTMSTALATAEQACIVLGKCITHKGNFLLTDQQGFFPPHHPFFSLKDLIFNCHEILGNGSFPWSPALQVKSCYGCISLQSCIEIPQEPRYQVLYNEHISSHPQNE